MDYRTWLLSTMVQFAYYILENFATRVYILGSEFKLDVSVKSCCFMLILSL